MANIDILIQNGTILTMNAQNQILHESAIAIKDGRILDIGSSTDLSKKYDAHRVLDSTNMAVLPGFIDTYAHAGHAMLKAIWHPIHGWPAGDLYFHGATKEFWYADGLLAAVDRLKCGVTTAVNIIGATPARLDKPDWAEAHAKAVEEIGIRDVIGVGPPDPFIPGQNELESTIWKNGESKHHTFTYADTIKNSIHIIEKWHNQANGRIKVALAFPYLCGRLPSHSKWGALYQYQEEDIPVLLEKAQEMRNLADKYGVQIHTHLYGGALEFGLAKFGKKNLYELLGPDVVLAHANSITNREIAILGETDTKVAAAPSAVSPTNFGRCPIPELIENGVCVATSTDGAAPIMSFDMFISIRAEMRIQRYHFQNPSLLPEGKALRMVTIDAARVLGLDNAIGSIEKGKHADIILLDTFQAHYTPLTMLPLLLVYYGSGRDVVHTIVDGKLVLENREIKTVDEAHVITTAREEIKNAFDRLEQLGYPLDQYKEMNDNFWYGFKQYRYPIE